ncbi:MAG: cobalt ECF transporter T component CbiQ [Bacillota bacterium]
MPDRADLNQTASLEHPAAPLPGWLSVPATSRPPIPSGRTADAFLDRTLVEFAHVTRHTVFAEEIARRNGFFQRLDARVKLGGFIALVLTVALAQSPVTLALVTLLAIAGAARSRVPAGFLIRRVWLLVAVFAGVMALPATLSVVTPGPTLLRLPFGLAITWTGLRGASLLVLRASASATLASVLTLTTRWDRLLAAAQGAGLPATFVAVVDLAYRYLFVLMAAALETFEARKARTVGPLRLAQNQGFVAAVAGATLSKARVMSEEVHAAMVARGYDGSPRLARLSPLGAGGVLGLAAFVAGAYIIFILDRVLVVLGA